MYKKNLQREGRVIKKKKCTDEGGLQTNQLKSENIVHTKTHN